MKTTTSIITTCLLVCAATASEPALTIYNQNFAVVRETIPLDLKANNQVRFMSATTFLDPVWAAGDPAGKRRLTISNRISAAARFPRNCCST
jgi:hypothetical protein